MQKIFQIKEKKLREPPAYLDKTDPILITQKNVLTNQDAKISPNEGKKRESLQPV